MSRTSKGKELLRITRRTQTSNRSLHLHPSTSTAPSQSSALFFDAAATSKHASSSSGHPSNPSPYALTPYNELLSSPFAFPNDALVLGGASFQQSGLHSINSPFLPFHHAPATTEPPNPGPSDLLGASPRRSDNKSASLCFRTNGAFGIPKRITVEGRLGKSSTSTTGLPGFRPNTADMDLRALKSVQVGEDAYFCRTDSLGVADGVGGWSGKKGADPALFSRLLMHYCAVGLERYDEIDDPLFLDYYNVDPIDILSEASLQSLEEARQKHFTGSSTALVAILRRDVLRVANLGDCNCSVIRGTEYLFRSEEQQHSFNYPMQVGTQSRDSPKNDAQRFDVKVQKDDIVILSSDGLIDNLFEEDILEEVLRFSHPSFDPANPSDPSRPLGKQAPFSPQAVSEALCSRAKAVIEDPLAVNSPFQQRAMEEGMYYTGGKPDDITVLVAVIGEERDSDDRR